MARILVIRLSAIGDVAMTIPVIYSLAIRYPQHEYIILSREFLKPLFGQMPQNVSFRGVNFSPESEYRGIKGLNKLYNQLKEMRIDYVADLHDVLRTKYLCLRFFLSGSKVAVINKGRIGKWRLVRRFCKVFRPCKTSFSRYATVFKKLGFEVHSDFHSIYGEDKVDITPFLSITGTKKEEFWIGIAPFARHIGKIYPLKFQEQIVAYFASQPQVKVFLFGGGEREEEVFNSWKSKYPSLVSLIHKLRIDRELALISHLDVMLSMDSANMHLASLVNVPVVSIWGATHPYAGFMGWNQSPDNVVQVDLPCRPCSVYGKKPCHRLDYACLNRIKPDKVIEVVEKILYKN